MDMVVRDIFDHVDFLEYHLALPLDLFVSKLGIGQHVGQKFHQDRQFAVHDRSMQTGVLPGGEGIGRAAEDIKLTGNIPGRPLTRSLEEHVFNKVGRTAVQVMFIPRTSIDPYTDRNDLDVRIRLRDNPDAVGEKCPVDHEI